MSKFRDFKTLQKFGLIHAWTYDRSSLDFNLKNRKTINRIAYLPWQDGVNWRHEDGIVGDFGDWFALV